MDYISLNDIRLYAYHGCLKEERTIGSDYLTHIAVGASLTDSAKSDQLSDTLDYVTIHQIAEEEMKKPSNLLEHVALRIINRILNLDLVMEVSVSISKINPPIGGDVANVTIKMTRKKL